jgi:hypothetical protein
MAKERVKTADNPEAFLFGTADGSADAVEGEGSRPLSPLRRPITPAAWQNPALYCRYPQCKKQFKSAFDLYAHTRKAHTDTRNFSRSVVPQRSSTSYRLADGEIDPRKRASPTRPNCSGLLPEVPKTRVPSPDKHGMMWPVEVLNAQKKFNEEHELASFRAHSAKLREYNQLVTADANWALNKSPTKDRPHHSPSTTPQNARSASPGK